jgi:hypothetical protein
MLAHDRVDIKPRACFFETKRKLLIQNTATKTSMRDEKRIDGDVEVVMLTGHSFVDG